MHEKEKERASSRSGGEREKEREREREEERSSMQVSVGRSFVCARAAPHNSSRRKYARTGRRRSREESRAIARRRTLARRVQQQSQIDLTARKYSVRTMLFDIPIKVSAI